MHPPPVANPDERDSEVSTLTKKAEQVARFLAKLGGQQTSAAFASIFVVFGAPKEPFCLPKVKGNVIARTFGFVDMEEKECLYDMEVGSESLLTCYNFTKLDPRKPIKLKPNRITSDKYKGVKRITIFLATAFPQKRCAPWVQERLRLLGFPIPPSV